MKYLLDVNALLAWGLAAHSHHARVRRWIAGLKSHRATLCTTPITELGFLRVASHPAYARTLDDARRILASMREAPGLAHSFLPDDLPGDRLPGWVQAPAQTTDGHLLTLAARHGAKLATFDAGISDALLIP